MIPVSAMGLGDVKLAGLIGLTLGWVGATTLLAGLLFSTSLGGVVGLGLIATGRAGWRTHIPLGPFMVAGAFAALLLRPS